MSRINDLLDQMIVSTLSNKEKTNTELLNEMDAIIAEGKSLDGIASCAELKEFESLFKAMRKRSEN